MASAAKRVARSAIDWAKFAQKVPKEELLNFQAFKSRSETYVTRVQSLPEALPSLDFGAYKSRYPSLAAIIDNFEKQYKSYQIPYPKPKDEINQIAQQEQAEKADTEKWIVDSNKRFELFKKDLAKWEIVPPFDHMCEQEWEYYFPGTYPSGNKEGFFLGIPDVEECKPENLPYQSDYRYELPPGQEAGH